MAHFRVAAPRTLDEAFSLLSSHGHDAKLVAGGTDVLIHIRAGKSAPKLLVLLSRIGELDDEIRVTETGIRIGALARLSDVVRHPVVSARFTALAEAAEQIGSEQIRNRGTVCGNVGNASPAGDTLPPLYTFDAVVNLVAPGGRRAVPIAAFVRGPGRTDLAPGELIESIDCPFPPEGGGSGYIKLARRAGIDISTVGAAALVCGDTVRLAMGAVGPTPIRAGAAELLLGAGLRDEAAFDRGIAAAAAATTPISDIRASRDYRLAMVQVLAREAIRVSQQRSTTKERVQA
ncbi:FAD binding domain-containing protein [Rhodoplanes elegans]|nr:xanthine dehydrogenase family protein subunit M [Rhodoplanes elegans]